MTTNDIILFALIAAGAILGLVIGFFIGYRKGFTDGRKDELYHVCAGEMYVQPNSMEQGQIRFIFRDVKGLFEDETIDSMMFEVIHMPDGTTLDDFDMYE